jgi:hypothetical protein
MDELVRLVAGKTGISEEQARTAVTTVVNFIKERLPGPLAAQIDNVMAGRSVDQDALKGLGGLFGKK